MKLKKSTIFLISTFFLSLKNLFCLFKFLEKISEIFSGFFFLIFLAVPFLHSNKLLLLFSESNVSKKQSKYNL